MKNWSLKLQKIIKERDMDEKKLKQDCHEDNLGQGILTLTTKRIAFDKTRF